LIRINGFHLESTKNKRQERVKFSKKNHGKKTMIMVIKNVLYIKIKTNTACSKLLLWQFSGYKYNNNIELVDDK
jgi:hypothetical protein